MVGARHLTLSGGLLSLGLGSPGGCGLWGGFFRACEMVLIKRGESSFPSSLFIFNPFGASLMYTFLSCRSVAVSSISTSSHSISWPACQACSATADLSKAASLQAGCLVLLHPSC